MKRKIIIRLSAIVLAIGLVLGILMATTIMPNQLNNGFDRVWSSNNEAKLIMEMRLDDKMAKIVGVSSNTIYLVGDNPRAVLMLNKDLVNKDTLFINYEVPINKLIPYTMAIDSPMIYLHINNMSSVISGRFPKENLTVSNLQVGLFTRSLQLTSNSVLIRSFGEDLTKQVFKKVDVLNKRTVVENDFINDRDNSGGMTSDGMLIRNTDSTRFWYVEYFRNKVYCIDSNLQVVYNSNTIDTFSTISINLKEQKVSDTSQKLVPSIARKTVNKDCFIDSKKLYILSALRGDNQEIRDFNRFSNIDTYDLTDGKYLGSFRISKLKNKDFKSAYVYNDTLIGLYDKQLVVYKLPR